MRRNKPKEKLPTVKTPPAYTPLSTDEWLEIGKIVSPQGLSGELRVYPVSDFPERFEKPGQRWILRPGSSEPKPIELLMGRYLESKNLYVVKLAGVSDRAQAEALRDYWLLVPASDRPRLAENEYHVLDLIGLLVFLQSSGELVGKVIDVIAAGNDLLEVQFDENFAPDKVGKTALIPFVMAIVPVVDLEQGRLEITLPEGLLEIS